jgi:hypothetical protein
MVRNISHTSPKRKRVNRIYGRLGIVLADTNQSSSLASVQIGRRE